MRVGRKPLKIAAIYSFIGLAWILVSDSLVNRWLDIEGSTGAQTAKGALYVLVTATIIYALVRQAVREAYRGEIRYRALFDSSPDALFLLDKHGNILDVNSQATAQYGYTREEFSVLTVHDLAGEDVRPRVDERLALAVEAPMRFSWRHRRKDGSEFSVEVNSQPVHVDGLPRTLSSVRDQTAWEEAEAARRESEVRLDVLLDAASDMVYMKDTVGRYTHVNAAFEQALGRNAEAIIGTRDLDLFPPAQSEEIAAVDKRVLSGEVVRGEFVRTMSGGDRIIETIKAPVRNDRGTIIALCGVSRDITERKEAEQALRESEERYRTLVETAQDAIVLMDDEKAIACNDAAVRILGCTSREDIIGRSPWDFSPPRQRDGEDSGAKVRAQIAQVLQGEALHFEWTQARPDGSTFDADVSLNRVTLNGKTYVQVITRDISERKQADDALRESEARYQTFVSQLTEGVYRAEFTEPIPVILPPEEQVDLLYARFRLAETNDAFARMYGYNRADEVLGKSLAEFHGGDDVPENRAFLVQFVEDGYRAEGIESHEVDLAGNRKVFTNNIIGIVEDGLLVRLWGTQTDITGRKRAEEDKARLEQQLLHAQKMEAVGQLAGGVAHDFNNLLQVISGHAEIALETAPPDAPVREDLEEITEAGNRAARLISQLLAFSRRQIMKPEPVDLNSVVSELLKMLRRLIGEHIELEFVPGHHLGQIHADRGMLDQVLMNLCINARDAMPEGGALTIETENVFINGDYCAAHAWAQPGRYVLLCVTDTGIGMDAATRVRVFEPFFSTKGVGRGTGLGLATAYGIVKQHDGMIQVYSEPGRGTTFKVYLPILQRQAASVGTKVEGAVGGGTEVILVAEDDPGVRRLARSILDRAGYEVITAEDGEDALEKFRQNQDRIDLLLVDVVMPRLGGRELFERARALCPGVRALFASGYSENAIHTNFILHEGMHLIEKPFDRAALLRAVRRMLDD
ncbi:MAG: PAS domain S-box protein [Candidatus Hydrogenedentota bacterium]